MHGRPSTGSLKGSSGVKKQTSVQKGFSDQNSKWLKPTKNRPGVVMTQKAQDGKHP